MKTVKAKKHLGQHFLVRLDLAEQIVDLLDPSTKKVLEVGPGMGVLTQYLLEKENLDLEVVEIDRESVAFLGEKYPKLKVHSEDFLNMYLEREMALDENEQVAIIGNFPYNISSQIFFKVLQDKKHVNQVVGMLQKEVAERIASPPGNRDYGILSVLLQAFYDIEYCFSVPPEAFDPPPRVNSGVIKVTRNPEKGLNCSEKNFKTVVKMGFGQRRKKLRNALKSLLNGKEHEYLDLRAEQLSPKQFEELTNLIFES